MAAKRGPRKVTESHKAAMAAGRTQSATVRRYLDAIEANKPKRGRKRTTEAMKKRLDAIEVAIADADKITELKLRQERTNLRRELAAANAKIDLADFEKAFISVAKEYGARQKITYQTWRDTGVSAAVLTKAGIGRAL